MPHGRHYSRVLRLVRKATVAFRANDWMLNQIDIDPDGLKYVAPTSVRGHWFLVATAASPSSAYTALHAEQGGAQRPESRRPRRRRPRNQRKARQ